MRAFLIYAGLTITRGWAMSERPMWKVPRRGFSRGDVTLTGVILVTDLVAPTWGMAEESRATHEVAEAFADLVANAWSNEPLVQPFADPRIPQRFVGRALTALRVEVGRRSGWDRIEGVLCGAVLVKNIGPASTSVLVPASLLGLGRSRRTEKAAEVLSMVQLKLRP